MAVRHSYRAFPSSEEADNMASSLREQGVDPNRISVVAAPSPPAMHPKNEATKTEETLDAAQHENLAMPLGAASAIGGAVAIAAGVTVGAGALMLAGPLLAIVAPAGALGATLGGFVGYLVGKGIPREDVDELEKALHNNGAVLVVDSNSSAEHEESERILNSLHAPDFAAKYRT